MQQGRQEGMQQGMQQGEAAVLERLLVRRFGPLDEATRSRLATASIHQLEQWIDNILDARNIEQVFGPD